MVMPLTDVERQDKELVWGTNNEFCSVCVFEETQQFEIPDTHKKIRLSC